MKTSSASSKPPTSSSTSKSTSKSTSSRKTTSSTASASPSPSTGLTTDQQNFLDLHNSFRPHYGAATVTWNSTLASYAASAAKTCVYGHTHGPYGENIAAGVGGGYDLTAGFHSWSDESQKYNYSDPGYSDATGHFTQIVWKATTQIGCAAQKCADGTIFTGYGQDSLYLVCKCFRTLFGHRLS
ncbi:CAP domain-containing protein [Naematelia encephala]|uniref:CAP domain-containing protein n=1 Tax=Naematelia encephala TaxID=71784 RepID=A0A1Y2BJA3_9TREE|nr:CAP domain-containing protein [Naematelia encephala]